NRMRILGPLWRRTKYILAAAALAACQARSGFGHERSGTAWGWRSPALRDPLSDGTLQRWRRRYLPHGGQNAAPPESSIASQDKSRWRAIRPRPTAAGSWQRTSLRQAAALGIAFCATEYAAR